MLQGKIRERLRDIVRQVCDELDVKIIKGALATDHVHIQDNLTVSNALALIQPVSLLRYNIIAACIRYKTAIIFFFPA